MNSPTCIESFATNGANRHKYSQAGFLPDFQPEHQIPKPNIYNKSQSQTSKSLIPSQPQTSTNPKY